MALASPGDRHRSTGHYTISVLFFFQFLFESGLVRSSVFRKSNLLVVCLEPFSDDHSPYDTHGVVLEPA